MPFPASPAFLTAKARVEAGVLAAEFTTGSTRRNPTLTLNRIAGGRREFVARHSIIGGKREARALALRLGATPWNF